MLGDILSVVVRHDVRRSNAGAESMGQFRDQISRRRGTPPRFLPSNGSRPHQIQHWSEPNFDIDRAFTLDIVSDNGARLIERNKKFFVNYKVGAGVDPRDRFGAINDAAENRFTVNRGGFASLPKGYAIRTENLNRISPNLQPIAPGITMRSTLLITKNGRATAGD